ncbi:TPA: hypothetical protein VJR00_001875, partial [Streptococcus pyogenes]|nr:hypothetical protein [Streptococcus pyogenes]
MTDKERERLEDMIIAILLSQPKIRHEKNGRSLFFKLDQRKIVIFLDYLQRFNIKSQFNFDYDSMEGQIFPSVMLENVLRKWVCHEHIQVVDPISLRLNAYYIWIGLFAKKTLNSVAIPTDLDIGLQHTLSRLFREQFETDLIPGNLMQIKPFRRVMLTAIKTNRPMEESMELSYLLPHKEKDEIKTLVA